MLSATTRLFSRSLVTFSWPASLFHGNDLSAKEMRTLRRYVRTHKPKTANNGVKELRLLSLRDFLKELFEDIYRARCLLVAFNHPFDLSRISSGVTSARGRYAADSL
jgi:hypothetical protein